MFAFWERGRPARNAALARGDTLTLALSHKGRGDPAGGAALDCDPYLISGNWLGSPTLRPISVAIFARKTKSETYPCKPIKGEGIR